MNQSLRLCCCAFVFAIFLFSCASSPKKEVVFAGTSATYSPSSETAVSISKPNKKNKKYTYFSRVSEEVMNEVENASPSSLRKAASLLRTNSLEYEEYEKVLLNVTSKIMKIVWPSERVDWESPQLKLETPYMGAIKSAENGIYDLSTGNVDFLTVLLPSLVVLYTDDVSYFYADSKKALLECLNTNPNSVLANYLLGQLYKKNKEYQKALDCFSKILQVSDCYEIQYAYGEVLVLLNDITKANNFFLEMLKNYPSNKNVLRQIANTSFLMKSYEVAEEFIAKVLQQTPNDLDALLFRAEILIEKKDYIHAASLLDVYSRQDSESKRYLLLRAKVQYDWSKNISAAITTIEKGLKLYPNDIDFSLMAAKLSSESLMLIDNKSVDYYADLVLRADPNNENALQYAVEGYIQKKQWEKAYSVSQKLINKKNASNQIIYRHVNICISLNKTEEAWALINPLYKSNQKDELIIQSYIIVLTQMGRINQALELINSLIPEVSIKLKSFLYYRRSFLQNNIESSLSDLRASLIANPRNVDSLYRLYQIYFDRKDYRKAQYYLKQVDSLTPNDAEIKQKLSSLNNLIN